MGHPAGVDVLASGQSAVSGAGDHPRNVVEAVRPGGHVAGEHGHSAVEDAVLLESIEEVAEDLKVGAVDLGLHLYGRSLRTPDNARVTELARQSLEGASLRELVREVVLSDAFRYRSF